MFYFWGCDRELTKVGTDLVHGTRFELEGLDKYDFSNLKVPKICASKIHAKNASKVQ